MPFKSEKQRRYLWLKHPDIAKRWADTYPTKKDLPMYADDTKANEKQSMAAQILTRVLPNHLRMFATSGATRVYGANIKKSDSKQEYVKLPTKHGPTFAGESDAQAEGLPEGDGVNNNNAMSPEKQDQVTASALFKKLAVVLSPVLMQEIEDEQAQQQAREAQRMPTNVGVKHTPPAVNSIMPPMGMAQTPPNPGQTQPAQPAQPQQPQQPPQQPANGQLAGVGGGGSPNSNPINAFGGLSSTGDINGNASLGTRNMAGGEKMSAGNGALAWLMSIDNSNTTADDDLDYVERIKHAVEKWSAACSCGCGDTVKTCKCSATCSCRKPGGSCYAEPVKKAGLLDFLTAPKLEKLETSGALPQDNKIYDWPRGQGFGAPYATAGGIPKGYKYLGTDHDGNSVLQGPDGKLVSMFHETGDLSRPTETVAPPSAVSVKQAQDFDPALSRDAENAVMHGTGLVGSGVLGTVAGIPVSAGLESLVNNNNWMPNSEKNPWSHLLMQGLLRTPILAGGMLGTRLYDNYILRPHMKREMERKQQEEAVRAQLMKKQADVSLQRVLGTALASTGGGLLLGSYPGWKLQRASEAAGNSDFTNFVAGKAPIALSGALSAGLYNHWLDSNEKKPKKEKPENPAHPSMQYLKYLVH